MGMDRTAQGYAPLVHLLTRCLGMNRAKGDSGLPSDHSSVLLSGLPKKKQLST